MKFNFKIQQYQSDAVENTVKVFSGQPSHDATTYRRDLGKIASGNLIYEEEYAGYKNADIELTYKDLETNVKTIQSRCDIPESKALSHDLGRVGLDIEMETGTGSKAYSGAKSIQDYIFTDGYAEESTEKKFAKSLDAASEVCVYAKLPRSFQIPTPVGNYSPDWAIAFNKGTVKHIYFIAETKGSMDSMQLKPIEKAKIDCAEKLFNDVSSSNVRYHKVDSYQTLLNIMKDID